MRRLRARYHRVGRWTHGRRAREVVPTARVDLLVDHRARIDAEAPVKNAMERARVERGESRRRDRPFRWCGTIWARARDDARRRPALARCGRRTRAAPVVESVAGACRGRATESRAVCPRTRGAAGVRAQRPRVRNNRGGVMLYAVRQAHPRRRCGAGGRANRSNDVALSGGSFTAKDANQLCVRSTSCGALKAT